MRITAIVTGGDKNKESVKIYNRVVVNGKDKALRIFRAKNDLEIYPSGEIKILETSKGQIKCHKLKEFNRSFLQDPTIDVSRDTKELWIPSKNLKNIKYPQNGVILSRDGVEIYQIEEDAACWEWALKGIVASVNDNRYDFFYNESHVNPINIPLVDIKTFTFIGLRKGWKKLVPYASDAVKSELEKAAVDVINTQSDGWNSKNRRFRRALMRVVVENAGFTVIEDDDRYQIHMRTSNFFGFDHWGISVKMTKENGLDGDRNYIQKIPSTSVSYNCNDIWDEYHEMETLSVLTLKDNHFKILSTIK